VSFRHSLSEVSVLNAVILIFCLGSHLGINQQSAQAPKPEPAPLSPELIPYLHARSVVDFPARELVERMPELKSTEFAAGQEPLADLLGRVGANVESLFRDFPNTSAMEVVNHEREAPGNRSGEYLKHRFHYMITTPTDPDGLMFEEYRTNIRDETLTMAELDGAYLLTTGHASSPMYFHPKASRGCVFRYLGRDKTPSRAHVIAFAQNPEIAQTTGSINLLGTEVLLLVQGIAWVDPDRFQILKMRLDLLVPRTDVGLQQHTTWIEFEEVHFDNVSRTVWLPREMRIVIAWKGWKFSNRHAYSQYRLFSVESRDGTKQIIRKP
jgi:hypothetical protein